MPDTKSNVKPLLQSLLVADHCYRDAYTGKAIVAGIYREIRVSRAVRTKNAEGKEVVHLDPAGLQAGFKSGSPFAFLSFTEVYGTQEVVLRYATLDGNRVAFEVKLQLTAPSPLDVVEPILGLPPLPQEEGRYELAVLWRNELLGSYRIKVSVKEQAVEQPPAEDENDG